MRLLLVILLLITVAVPVVAADLHPFEELLAGNRRFVADQTTRRRFSTLREHLVAGQHPPAVVLGCADSRVPPELLFDRTLGELFVVRTAGNVVDDIALGSLEYGIEHLHAKVLLVLAHQSCGAVKATVEAAAAPPAPAHPGSHIGAIVAKIMPAVQATAHGPAGDRTFVDRCIVTNLVFSMRDLLTRSSVLRDAVQQAHIAFVGGYYSLASGEVEVVVDPVAAHRLAAGLIPEKEHSPDAATPAPAPAAH